MRLGIRAKLIGTLLLAGLLPLALTLGVILIGMVELRIQSRGRLFRALAQQQAGHLSTILAAQVEWAKVVNGMPKTTAFLQQANAREITPKQEIDRIEASWPKLGPEDEPLRACLTNDIARRWQSVARSERRFSEVMVTDVTGRLVAATNKTTDYFQADEEWWQKCFDGGRGRVLISDVKLDESARPADAGPNDPPGTLVADLCLPIYDAPDSPERKVLGITKISLDASWMLRQLDLGVHSDELPRATWLVLGDGKAVPGARPAPPIAVLPPDVAQAVRKDAGGWLKKDQMKGLELVGFAAVEQSRLIEREGEQWHVVVATPLHEVVSSVHRIAWVIFFLGVGVIAACFIGGLVIAGREVIRPIRTLDKAFNALKTGDRDYRLSEERGGRHVFGYDEIGSLARHFNVMADQIRDHLVRLERADEVKRQFIDLASHELRTPVTYILGASQLAQRQNGSNDQGANAGGGGGGGASGTAAPIMSKISGKAQRLNRIVENMFKLLGSDHFDRALRTADVDVAALVHDVVAEHEPFLRERRQRWEVDVAPGLPTIRGDAEKIRDILSNLVSNAIRFSPDGGVVGVRAAAVDDAVEVTVTDSGTGIPEADLPNLFQPFFTGQGVSRHSSGDYQHMSRGMGLGLSVVKRFVELHGGTVSVDSRSTGTRITVRLPRATGETPTPAPA
jgi:signal transduction histidine kinase